MIRLRQRQTRSDDTASFVRQQYRDFLNRDADAAGLAFWKNNIDKCNDPAQRPAGQTLAQCIEVQRIVTSAAFFLSIEFTHSRRTGARLLCGGARPSGYQ